MWYFKIFNLLTEKKTTKYVGEDCINGEKKIKAL